MILWYEIEIAFWTVIGGTPLACLLRPSPDLIREVQFVHQPAYLDTNLRFIFTIIFDF